MSSSEKLDIKMVAAVLGIAASLSAAGGSWYVNSYRIDQLEKDNVEVVQKIADTKCFIAQVHEIPLPECL